MSIEKQLNLPKEVHLNEVPRQIENQALEKQFSFPQETRLDEISANGGEKMRIIHLREMFQEYDSCGIPKPVLEAARKVGEK